MCINHRQKSMQRGFTMIEVLIAVFVLAIGLLGLASLQTRSLQFNFSAYQRSQANVLAYDIIDRMRANRDVVLAGGYAHDLNDGPVSSTNCQGAGASCSAGDMAQFDLTQWVCSLGKWNSDTTCTGMSIEGPLAEGDGSVTITPSGTRAMVTVTINWVDDRTLDVDDENRMETFSVSSVL